MRAVKSYEEGLARLQEILDQLSDEDTPLEKAVSLYADAAKLIAGCSETLQAAKVKVEEIDLQLEQKKESENGI